MGDSGRSGPVRTVRRPAVVAIVLAFVPLLACDGDPADPGDDVVAGVLDISSTSAAWAGDAAGAAPAPVTIDVTASGGPVGELQVVVHHPAGSPVDWLSAELSAAAPPATLTLTADPGALAWGFYQAAVVVNGTAAAGDPQIVFVELELACAPPAPGSFTVCGTLIDIETGATAGAALDVSVYDAIAFASDPGAATPLTTRSTVTDASRRFHVVDAEVPGLGYALLTAGGQGTTGHVRSGVSRAVVAGGHLTSFVLPTITQTTVDAWTTSAADPFPTGTFADSGAVVSVFSGDGQPASSVEVTVGGSPGSTFYFDPLGTTLSALDPSATVTGESGAALTIRSGFVPYSGQGGEPAGCEWPSDPAAPVPDLIWVLAQVAVDAATGRACG